MKKLFVFLILVMVVFFQYCSSAKKAQKAKQVTTYTTHVQPIIAATCSPCHIPPGGNKKALNTYETAKANIDDIISRIQKNPDERGFMPFRHPKLSQDTIQVFVNWKAEGLAE